jgi:hypothetical protein
MIIPSVLVDDRLLSRKLKCLYSGRGKAFSLYKMASNRKLIASEANCLEVVRKPNGEVYLTYHPDTTIACVFPNGDYKWLWRCCERRSDKSGCTTHVISPATPPDSPTCGPGELQRQFGVREPVYSSTSPPSTSPPPSSQETSHNRLRDPCNCHRCWQPVMEEASHNRHSDPE